MDLSHCFLLITRRVGGSGGGREGAGEGGSSGEVLPIFISSLSSLRLCPGWGGGGCGGPFVF